MHPHRAPGVVLPVMSPAQNASAIKTTASPARTALRISLRLSVGYLVYDHDHQRQ